MTKLLQAQNLVKYYKSRQVVNNVSVNIAAGDIVGLLGPNGAGKTTCFYMIVGLIACDDGKILLDDTDITNKPMHARARLGISYLPQEVSVFRKMTVAQNILAILELNKQLNKQVRYQRLENLLQDFHITHVRDSMGYSLSGGERRRVEIARALATEPQFILLDEPFAGIDPISVVDIKRIIVHLTKERGIGVLITDHNVRDTLAICQRAYILNEGCLIAEGVPQAIMQNQRVKEVYLGEEFYI